MKRWRKRVTERITGKINLCPTCELIGFTGFLRQKQSYTRQRAERSTLKLCAELRAEAEKYGKYCRHFRGELLNGFLQIPTRRRKRK